MKKVTLAMLAVVSVVAGCATGKGVSERGTALVDARSAKIFVQGPALVHAYSLDRGGEVFLAPALTGTDTDCAAARTDGTSRPRPVEVDRRNVVEVRVGEVACVTSGRARPYELMWHAWKAPADDASVQLAHNR